MITFSIRKLASDMLILSRHEREEKTTPGMMPMSSYSIFMHPNDIDLLKKIIQEYEECQQKMK